MAVVYWIRAPHHTDIFTEGYVGFSSKTAEDRFKTHKTDAKRFSHFPIYRAMEKYGDSIVLETVLEGPEDYCLDVEFKLRPEPKIGWNLNCGGGKGPLGTKASEDTKKKLSDAHKGEKNHFYGKTHSEETREKIRTAHKNLAPEIRQRITAANPMIGASHKEETKRKISESLKANKNVGRYERLPWNHYSAIIPIWIKCAEFYKHVNEKADGFKTLAKVFGFTNKQLRAVVRKLETGWNPLEDKRWLEFYNNHKDLVNG